MCHLYGMYSLNTSTRTRLPQVLMVGLLLVWVTVWVCLRWRSTSDTHINKNVKEQYVVASVLQIKTVWWKLENYCLNIWGTLVGERVVTKKLYMLIVQALVMAEKRTLREQEQRTSSHAFSGAELRTEIEQCRMLRSEAVESSACLWSAIRMSAMLVSRVLRQLHSC